MLYGGAKGVGGSISVDALNMRKFLGLEEDIVVGPRDWWTMDTIDENIAFLSRKSTVPWRNRRNSGLRSRTSPFKSLTSRSLAL